MLTAVLMIAQAVSAELPDRYRTLTRADVPCIGSEGDADIVVCGRRAADDYRVPFVVPAESDRDRPLDYAERLLDGGTNTCGITTRTFSNCGMVGVSVRAGFDGKVTRERPLAP